MDESGTGERTTRGGITKTKFTPNVAAAIRRAPKEDPGASEAPTKQTAKPPSKIPPNSSRGGVRGRGRGRGTSGGGLLGISQVVASGPFAHGPATSLRSQRDSTTALMGGGSFSRAPTNTTTQNANSTKAFSIGSGIRNVSIGGIKSTTMDECDEKIDLDEMLSKRSIGDHLPISLLSLDDVQDNKKVDPGIISNPPCKDENHQMNLTTDDKYSCGSKILTPGRLMLFQLPACLPPLAIEDKTLKPSIHQSTATASLLGVGESEKALDIETFKTIEAARAEATQRSTSWPLNAEGYYGKLRIHKSGQVSILVNGRVYMASPSTVRPEITGICRVVAIDADYEQSFDLGTILENVIFIPTIEQLLANF